VNVRKMVSSGSPYEIPIGFSRAVRVGDVIAVSGTAPIASDGSTASAGDPYGQTKRCLEIIQRAIEDLGGELSDVIRTRIFVTDMSKWEEIGRAHGEIFGEIRPASSIVEVTSLASKDWIVEIEADCIITGK
jgi:enamine deaminase RidA (YjgF/YER057c/UK114 family)